MVQDGGLDALRKVVSGGSIRDRVGERPIGWFNPPWRAWERPGHGHEALEALKAEGAQRDGGVEHGRG